MIVDGASHVIQSVIMTSVL